MGGVEVEEEEEVELRSGFDQNRTLMRVCDTKFGPELVFPAWLQVGADQWASFEEKDTGSPQGRGRLQRAPIGR